MLNDLFKLISTTSAGFFSFILFEVHIGHFNITIFRKLLRNQFSFSGVDFSLQLKLSPVLIKVFFFIK